MTRALVVTGGWQTSKEPAYVEASRARHGTDWYVNREELGAEGHDAERIERFAENMRRSRRQTPSLEHRELPDPVPSEIALDRDLASDRALEFGACRRRLSSESVPPARARGEPPLSGRAVRSGRYSAARAGGGGWGTARRRVAAHMVRAGVGEAAREGKVRRSRATEPDFDRPPRLRAALV